MVRGWALAAAAAFPTLATWMYFVAVGDQATGVQQFTYSAAKLLQFAFPLAWVVLVRRERLRWRPKDSAGIATGLWLGLLFAGGMLLVYYAWLRPGGYVAAAAAPVAAKVHGFGLSSPAAFLAWAVFLSALHSLMEEYYWRWFVFGRLRGLVPPWLAVLLSSVAFTAHHVLVLAVYFGWRSPQTAIFSLGVTVGGLAWAWLYQRSGSLVGPWLQPPAGRRRDLRDRLRPAVAVNCRVGRAQRAPPARS